MQWTPHGFRFQITKIRRCPKHKFCDLIGDFRTYQRTTQISFCSILRLGKQKNGRIRRIPQIGPQTKIFIRDPLLLLIRCSKWTGNDIKVAFVCYGFVILSRLWLIRLPLPVFCCWYLFHFCTTYCNGRSDKITDEVKGKQRRKIWFAVVPIDWHNFQRWNFVSAEFRLMHSFSTLVHSFCIQIYRFFNES